MTNKTSLFHPQALAAALCLAGVCFGGQAQAQLINIDVTSSANADKYSTGVGAFGTASSHWNEVVRTSSASNLALTDDTGAATPVTISYARSASGAQPVSGAFAALGGSQIVSGAVTFAGLTPGGIYDLAIYSSWTGTLSFTVESLTHTFPSTLNWSSLTEGSQYVLFQAVVADGSGLLSFTPNANPGGGGLSTSTWSAFQLQTAAAAVPEPASLTLLLGGLGVFGMSRRKARRLG